MTEVERREKAKIAAKKWRDEHKEQAKAACKKWRDINKDYNRQRMKDWRKNNPKYSTKYRSRNVDKVKNGRLRREYGISEEQYNELFLKQDGKCAICRMPEVKKVHDKVIRLSVDHSHTDGNVRELLCNSCNLMLGHSKDNELILKSAIEYLNKHSRKAG